MIFLPWARYTLKQSDNNHKYAFYGFERQKQEHPTGASFVLPASSLLDQTD